MVYRNDHRFYTYRQNLNKVMFGTFFAGYTNNFNDLIYVLFTPWVILSFFCPLALEWKDNIKVLSNFLKNVNLSLVP